ncbi:hypothetical protein MJO29_004871 [Puccinia striiformis f. sp. tritici]|uniref:UDP-N-acetylglucosamine transferase subunit ALG14 n=3 Tax=Puccinia striiformis TaxID=27350 RepID=A0A0L0VMR2_9BASI|nr:hypothetical protein Pst134EA_009008 [Puccinia striiformis f. sp. tritici]KAI9609588.1 hypothetical protein H4Q26_007548 [Puccinia striiformis f. sp. tritici PST-130]KNF00541.1 hypothetical protein PSTG_06233 [Puccinia striiformis f. sp. tritici PST-78]KAH9457713.1 hypothetical protein Pst134EB_010032 [Puccinia striiformis f. sp. tritici]KAH9468464.1 hypothetical protein Pst134EA_009008 [Puccinia striiformis f. sp. tritici]KAI7959803.1 hypothetical protein MJO29_004871 [Puccinia striiformis
MSAYCAHRMTMSLGLIGQLCGLLFILSVVFFLRLVHVIRLIHQGRSPLHSSGQPQTCRLTVLLGSGGHTGEMIRLLSDLPFNRYTPRTYVISSADVLSMSKAIELERTKPVGQYTFLEIPRARRVNQSFLTSIFTTINSLLVCLWCISIKPNRLPSPVKLQGSKVQPADLGVVILNGPGSSVPIALSVFLPRLITGKPIPRLIYVESLARIKRLSLTGILLLPFVDHFIVQWEVLQTEIHQSKLYQILHRFNLVPPVTFDGWMV